jgi:drug/metabolite transporter, DME family
MTTVTSCAGADAAHHRRTYLYGCALVLLAGFVLSLGVFAIRGATASDALQYLLWRAVGFTAAMTIAAWLRDHRSPLRQISGLSRFGWLAAAAMTVSQMTFVSAVKIAPFAEVFFLCSLAPLMAAALAGPLLGERMGWLGAAAIAMGLAGVWVMTGGAGLSAASLGVSGVLSLVSALAFALYSLATRGSVAGDRDATLIVAGLASFVVAAGILLARGLPLLPSVLDAGIAMLHGAIVLAAGLFLFGQGSRYIPGVTFAMLAQFEAVIAPLWGFLYFAENSSLGVIAGGALILTAVVLQAIDGAGRISSKT